jgi:hypothetical protein
MKRICFGIIYLLISFSVYAQNEKTKASFIYNFTKYISWPDDASQGNFVIGVYGSPAMSDELKAIAGTRKVGTRSIDVLDFASVGSMQKCHLVYVPDGKKADLDKVIEKFRPQPVVVVSDVAGAILKGGAINFIMVDGKQNFEVKKDNVEKNGIKVNSQLLNLGVER